MVWSRRAILVLLSAATPLLSGCQIGYLVSSAYHQVGLLNSRVPIEEALKNPSLTEEQRRKLRLALEAHRFAENNLGLHHSKSYTTYTQLDRPYVTYVVSAAPKDELTAYKWWFPVVGSLPYKGYFNPDRAKEEADEMKAKGFDTSVRGVSAYSTLGWFSDPILSSMLRYKDYELVNTVIHETVHATIYIKSEADFNERLAVFIGNQGTEEFYRLREGAESPTLAQIANNTVDEKLFSDFIFREMKNLEEWYAQNKSKPDFLQTRPARLKEIQQRFVTELKPHFKEKESYGRFESSELNNATLLTYRLYFENLGDFEAVFNKLGRDFHKMVEFCKTLESAKDPKKALADAGH